MIVTPDCRRRFRSVELEPVVPRRMTTPHPGPRIACAHSAQSPVRIFASGIMAGSLHELDMVCRGMAPLGPALPLLGRLGGLCTGGGECVCWPLAWRPRRLGLPLGGTSDCIASLLAALGLGSVGSLQAQTKEAEGEFEGNPFAKLEGAVFCIALSVQRMGAERLRPSVTEWEAHWMVAARTGCLRRQRRSLEGALARSHSRI